MKKTTWLLLALSLVAVLLVAGCTATTPKPTVSPTPTATPPPPPANYCPSTDNIKTLVTGLYCGTDWQYAPMESGGDGWPSFSILISFDEDIILLDDDPNNWTVTVDRWVHYKDADGNLQKYEPQDIEAEVEWVEQVGDRSIRIEATVEDLGPDIRIEATVEDLGPDESFWEPFYGLICGETCYKEFVRLLNEAAGGTEDDPQAVAIKDFYVDSVSWAYTGNAFPYADTLGNPCLDSCEIKGNDCCEACEPCPSPSATPPCPPGGCI